MRDQNDRDSVSANELAANAEAAPVWIEGCDERRRVHDRRRYGLKSLFYGSIKPRRRTYRRAEDADRGHLDWHDSNLLYASILILLFSSADAVLTLNLIYMGAAEEINLFMKKLIETDVFLFGLVKMALTGTALVVLVALARYCVFRVVKVGQIIAWTLAAYVALIGYELILIAGA